MTPLLRTRHTWQVCFGEMPLPSTLPRDFDVVRVSMGLGMAAIEAMIDSCQPVGPLLCCNAHQGLLVPVESGTADVWGASHSQCGAGRMLRCETPRSLRACHNRIWVTPPEPLASVITEARVLHDYLSLTRSLMRHASRLQPGEVHAGEACHV
jgi:hypothetical protein